MHTRKLGSTGRETSILGFGCMRLPLVKEGEKTVDEKEAIRLIRKGIDNGITYVDTAYFYHQGQSEIVLGKALKEGYREKVTLMTKNPVRMVEKADDYTKFLEEQLTKLDVETIDVYLFHGLTKERYETKVEKFGLMELALKAKEEGKIKHIGFSSHDTPENIKFLIDTGHFEVMLVQYNIIDPVNEDIIAHAGKKGMGVSVMGPVAGGRLALEPPEQLKEYLTEDKQTFVDLAFKFVWSNTHVSVALSGMGSEEMVTTNLALASNETVTLTADEKKNVKKIESTYKQLSDVICTQCGYCEPCEQEVNIKQILKQLIHWEVYGWNLAKRYYAMIGKSPVFPGKNATACNECGSCEEKCPQGLPIIENLKKAHKLLSE